MSELQPDSLFAVAGRVVVVTGASGQLGRAYVQALVERGARVAALDLVVPTGTPPEGAGYYRADITCRDELISVYERIRADLGMPAVLVNNAALDSPPNAPVEDVGPFETYPEESFDRVMEVNVKGTFLCCQVFGGAMAEAGAGSIINIASIYGMVSPCQDIYEFRRQAGQVFYKPVAYSASKSAIFNLTRYLATYWAKKGVRVNTLTLAGVFNNQPKAFLDAYCARMPVGRMAVPGDYIGPLLFLASEASRYMTGANVVVDGGWTAW